MKCDICGRRIYRKYYSFEDKNWCHACVEEERSFLVETDDKGEDTTEAEADASTQLPVL